MLYYVFLSFRFLYHSLAEACWFYGIVLIVFPSEIGFGVIAAECILALIAPTYWHHYATQAPTSLLPILGSTK